MEHVLGAFVVCTLRCLHSVCSIRHPCSLSGSLGGLNVATFREHGRGRRAGGGVPGAHARPLLLMILETLEEMSQPALRQHLATSLLASLSLVLVLAPCLPPLCLALASRLTTGRR